VESKQTGTILDYQGADVMGGPTEEKVWTEREHDYGVSFLCPWEDPFGGFPEHSRRLARALDDAGLPVHLRSLDPSMQWHQTPATAKFKDSMMEGIRDLLTRSVRNYLVSVHMTVAGASNLHAVWTHRFLDPEQLKQINQYKIISTVFERDRLVPGELESFLAVGQVWVANEKDREMLVSQGVPPFKVKVVPIPFFEDDPHLKIASKKRRAGPTRFYAIGKWEARKAHHELLGTFFTAFAPGEAKLYFKTSTKAPDFGEYPSSPAESVARWLDTAEVKEKGWDIDRVNQDVFLINRFLAPKRMVELHENGDVYVSLSRGEGFDMPAYDASLADNLLVHTPSGGPQDYAASDAICVSATGSIPSHPWYDWPECEYLDWEITQSAAALRQADALIQAGRTRSPRTDLGGFTAKSVGVKIRAAIEEVATLPEKQAQA
jgi:hypothetical protein